MKKTKRHIFDRMLAMMLSVLMIAALVPENVLAVGEGSQVTTTLPDTIYSDEVTYFDFTSSPNTTDAGQMIFGVFEVYEDGNPIDLSTIAKLEYKETQGEQAGQWFEFYGKFGPPETGFPFIDATSSFRVTFSKVGTYEVVVKAQSFDGLTDYCQTSKTITVKGKSSELTTNIGEKTFNVGDATEFDFGIIANSDAGKYIFSSFEIKNTDTDATVNIADVAKLEYKESQDGNWYEFYGDFGPVGTGFPMTDATSYFRVTFKQEGNYTVIVKAKDAQNGTIYSQVSNDIVVEHKVDVYAPAVNGGTIELNGSTDETIVVDVGSDINVNIIPFNGYQIKAVTVNGETQVVSNQKGFALPLNIIEDTTIEVVFVQICTITVNVSGNGTVDMTPAGDAGFVTVEMGTNVELEATPSVGHHVSEVIINDEKQADVIVANDSVYNKILNATQEYIVKITFAPNIYYITAKDMINGSVNIQNYAIEYSGDTKVYITPDADYTIETVSVNGNDVTANVVKDSTGIYIEIEEIQEHKEVAVTFKEIEKASTDDFTVDSDNKVIRNDGSLYVIKDGDAVNFEVNASGYGIALFDAKGNLIVGDETAEVVSIFEDKTVELVKLYYKADSELYADWHEVEFDAKIVVDKQNPEATITTTPEANQNGYHNADITVTVDAVDRGDYSGLAKVEYWLTKDGTDSAKAEFILDGNGIKAGENTFVVDASVYNSANVNINVHVVDNAGNEDTIVKSLKINSTIPSVSLDIDGTKYSNAQDTYYNDKRVLTISVEDRVDTFDPVAIVAGLKIKKNGSDITVAESDIIWTNPVTGVYVGTYGFNDDAEYEWTLSYTNKAGMTNNGYKSAPTDKDLFAFTVDKANPYNLNISYNPVFIDVLLETITFGFYKAPVEVTMEAVDDTAGVYQFNYTYGNESGVITGRDIQREGDKASAKFTIPSEFRGTVGFTVTDRAGRTAELADDKEVVIDTIAPGVTVTWEPVQGYNGKYFNADRMATIAIEESNFFAQDVEDGLLMITSKIVYNDGSSKNEIYKPVFTLKEGKYVATIIFSEEADYTFDVAYTDRSGNVYDEYPAEEFTIDKTKPIISVSYDNNTAINDNQFKAERKATITVVEHNFAEFAMQVLVNGNVTQVEWREDQKVADTYIAEVPFTGDAHYILEISGKDLADNANDGVTPDAGTVAPWAFTVDKSGPTDLKITYESTFVGTLLEGITFGFYKAPVIVKIEATDDVSGIDYFTYSYVVQDGASVINVGKQNVKVDVNEQNFITFEIPAQFRGFVSFTATNKSGVSASTADVNAIVVDSIAPGINVVYGNYDALNDVYYKADRTVTITIEEANFFAQDMEDGLLVITRKAIANDGTIKEETLSPEFIKNGDIYTATVKFDQDADYTFDIAYTDRAGNAFADYTADVFTVDKIAPVISIEKANGAYFNMDRSAKITVVEHNFRASDFEFKAEAYDVTGKTKIDLSSKDYKNYLKNQENWTKVADDTWEVSLNFDIEGNYTVGATYTDLAGNVQVAEINDTFCVDKQDVGKDDPNNLKITYSSTFIDTLLENLTFGFYQAPVEVVIEATDDIAGVDHFVYSYTVQNGASATNVGKINQTADATRDGDTNRWYTTFSIAPQFRGMVSFIAYDKATNYASLADENAVVVDNVAPGINVVYSNLSDYDDEFYKADRTATITIEEANFFAQDIEDGLLVITVEKTLNDGTYTSTNMSPVFTKNGDIYTATIEFAEEADYTFDIKYTDRSGNVYDSYEKDVFTVDKTAPVINISYDNNDAKNNDQFKANRVAIIKIIEHNFRADYVTAKAMANGIEVTRYAEYLKNDANWSHEDDVHTAVIEYKDEAHYTFEISCVDKAGVISSGVNYGESVAPSVFTLDKTAPTEMDIKIADKSVKGSMNTHVFDTFYGAAITIKLSANCDISGLESFKYQKVADVSEYEVDGTWADYDAKIGIVINPSEKFVIYFRAEDRAGNVDIIRSTGIVVDNQKPIGETNAPEIDILPATPNANGLHRKDVVVDLKVVDPKYVGVSAAENGHYSGLNTITYKIYTTDTDTIEEGTLLDLAYKTEGSVFDTDKLVSSWSGKITIDSEKFNSNNVIVEVTAVDNAGNERKTTTNAGDIQIDITVPTIVISYDNNDADSESFFKADRTATVVITERNFNAKDVVVTIENTDGAVPTISEFIKKAGTTNGDDTTWTAIIKYTADGDYTFDIAYTDLAENECVGENFVENTVASNEFTIDQTAPTIAVSYDNNDALNGNYYKAIRIATVVITEHNFNADRVIITHTATDDGAETTKPVISGWSTNGDKHTATIYYGKDAKYTFDIAMNDKAGNASSDYAEEIFCIDTTMPTLEITGVEDLSANNGDVIPVLLYSDTNYDAEKVTITLTGANRKSIELDGSYADIHNGRTFTFKNFAKEQAIDDIYTLTALLTDKAGNTTEKNITFSVNRFGSTYALGEVAEKLNGTYIQEPVDVVITETNADELSDIVVTIFKNNETIVLKEDTDYKIDVTGGNGQWYHYTYTILAKNFADDAVYAITVESADAAGNDAKNDQDTKNTAISFGIDDTLPIINIENLESKTTYALDNMTVKMSIEDNLKLAKVIVELDGKEIRVWSAEALEEIVKNGGNFSIDISGESTNMHNLVVYAVDVAGNGEKVSDTELPANAELVEDFYVTTNLWVRYYTNEPLFFGSMAGVILVASLSVILVVYKKKKNEEK